MASFIDHTGAMQQVPSIPLNILRNASAQGTSPIAAINANYRTRPNDPPAFLQMCASEGLNLASDPARGINAMPLGQIFNQVNAAAPTVADSAPASRVLFPLIVLNSIETVLRNNDYGITKFFAANAALVDNLAGTRFTRAVIDVSRPENQRSQAVAQLGEPKNMLSITASDKTYAIGGTSIGLIISQQAAAVTTLPLVALTMQRQAETEAIARIEEFLLSFLNGDQDVDMPALSAISGAVNKAVTFDSSISANGELTQLAWMQWLLTNNRKRTITHVVTDLKGALAIQNRKNRPTVLTDNGTSKRIDTIEMIGNPGWMNEVTVIITQDPNWPANTIVGFDKRYGYHLVNSTVLDYQAMEEFAMRRATAFRVDSGSLAYRLYDDAWSVLTLTL